MTDYVMSPPAQAAVPVASGGLFPVRRVFCVGRNYAAHAREMGHDPEREAPFFFMKPADSLVTSGADTPYPSMTAELHHELELVVALGSGGADVAVDAAMGLVWGCAVGLDMTRRDLQAEAKAAGRPWDMGKGFDHSAPISDLVRTASVPTQAALELRVNGAVRQRGDLSQLIWSVPETIAALSRLVRLAPGDLIFTGTPEGVAAVARGDVLEGTIESVGAVRTRIV